MLDWVCSIVWTGLPPSAKADSDGGRILYCDCYVGKRLERAQGKLGGAAHCRSAVHG